MANVTLPKSAGSFASGRVLRALTEETAPASPSKPEWQEIDPSTLVGALRAKYEALVSARRAAAVAKAAFEDAMNQTANPGPGLRLVFGYNFGKLSVAVVEAERAKPKASKAAISFADYVARR
jgi:hypothetical protein